MLVGLSAGILYYRIANAQQRQQFFLYSIESS